jgi:hypothetical protein
LHISETYRIFAAENCKIMTELVVQVEDASLVADLKRAIKMLRGVSGVTIPKRQKRTGIEKGLDDIKKGNVYHAKNSQDLIKQILG